MRLSPVIRTVMLVTASALAAGILIATSWRGTPSAEFWFWAVVCLAGEILWVRLPLGRATDSMASACNFAALLLLVRGEAMAAVGLSVLVAELTFMHKPPQRALYNAGQTAFAIGVAHIAFVALGGTPGNPVATILGFNLLPVLVAALVYTLLNSGATAVAVAVTERMALWTAWHRNVGNWSEFVSSAVLFILGMVMAVLYASFGMAAALSVGFPILLTYVLYRRRREEAKREEELSPAA